MGIEYEGDKLEEILRLTKENNRMLHKMRRSAFLGGLFKFIMWAAFIIIPLLAPVAQKLGIDLIWFGVILAVNMQTSFMHPPFGFALFYLRSVAPKEVRTTDIYWGAAPFVLIQIVMIALVLAFPQLVGHAPAADITGVMEIQLPTDAGALPPPEAK